MHLIQPCCAKKDLRELRESIAKGGTKEFEGYGDLSLTELLPALLLRYDGVEMMIVAPSLPDQAADVITRWMNRQWARRDGKGKLDVIGHLTIIAKLDKDSSHYITTWLKDKPFGDRLTLVDIDQEETAILLPDFAITGPINMRYGNHFVATATTESQKVAELWKKFRAYEIKASQSNGDYPRGEKKSVRKKPSKRKRKA